MFVEPVGLGPSIVYRDAGDDRGDLLLQFRFFTFQPSSNFQYTAAGQHGHIDILINFFNIMHDKLLFLTLSWVGL